MEIINTIEWLKENYVWIINIAIQSFIAYHIFFLSRKISTRTKLRHKNKIKKQAEKILCEIYRKKLNSKIYLVNTRRYFKDYPSNKERRILGYSHIRAEIKSTRFDGVEFFAEMPKNVYRKPNGQLSFNENTGKKEFIVYPVGIVPYEWIDYIDPEGDEYGYVPLIHCFFKGKIYWKFWRKLLFFGYPYKKIIFYKKSEFYEEKNDPYDMKYIYFSDKISKK